MTFSKKIRFTLLLTFGIFSLYSQSFNNIKTEIDKITPFLFGGQWNDSLKEVTWKPDAIKRHKFGSYFMEDTDTLLQTKFDTLIYFNTNEERFALLFFTTYNEHSYGTRYSNVTISVAMFEQVYNSDSKWVFNNFKENLNIPARMQGDIDGFRILDLGNCHILQLTNSVVWAGTQYDTEENLFSIFDNFQLMFNYMSSVSGKYTSDDYYEYKRTLQINPQKHTFTISEYGENFDAETKKLYKMDKTQTYKIESTADDKSTENKNGVLFLSKIFNP